MDQKTKSAVSRTKILDAAVKEFSHIRYEKASINQICRDGGISKGRLYYYYESKEQLYYAAAQRCFSRLGDHVCAFTPQPELPMEENILRFIAVWQDLWRSNPQTAYFMGRVRLSPPDSLRESIIALFVSLRERVLVVKLQEIFRIYFPGDETRQRLFAAISYVAISYIAGYIGASQVDKLEKQPDFFDKQMQLFKTLVHIFLHGCMNVEVPPLDF